MENRTRGTDVSESGGLQQNAQAKVSTFDVVGSRESFLSREMKE